MNTCVEFDYSNLTDVELGNKINELFNEWFDIRRTLDEQLLVNNKMYNNHYIYEARELVAKAKFLYAKAEQMMRIDKKDIMEAVAKKMKK